MKRGTNHDLRCRVAKLNRENHDLAERVVNIEAQLVKAQTELVQIHHDIADGAGAILAPVPEIGSDLAYVLAKNGVLRRDRDNADKHRLVALEKLLQVDKWASAGAVRWKSRDGIALRAILDKKVEV